MSARTLKIEATGDFFAGTVKPKIRLCGKWLERAGFKPGQRVELVVTEPGTLTLRAVTDTASVPQKLLISGQLI